MDHLGILVVMKRNIFLIMIMPSLLSTNVSVSILVSVYRQTQSGLHILYIIHTYNKLHNILLYYYKQKMSQMVTFLVAHHIFALPCYLLLNLYGDG